MKLSKEDFDIITNVLNKVYTEMVGNEWILISFDRLEQYQVEKVLSAMYNDLKNIKNNYNKERWDA